MISLPTAPVTPTTPIFSGFVTICSCCILKRAAAAGGMAVAKLAAATDEVTRCAGIAPPTAKAEAPVRAQPTRKVRI